VCVTLIHGITHLYLVWGGGHPVSSKYCPLLTWVVGFGWVSVNTTQLASASMDQTVRLWDVETGKHISEFELQAGSRCVSIASGDKMLAVVQDPYQDQQSCVRIFDVTSNQEIKKIDMEYGCPKANRALFGPLNKKLIVVNEGGGLLGYDVASGECEVERCDNEVEIPDLSFSHDQMTFIVACKDHTATLYDTHSMEPIKKYQSDRPINSAAMSPLMDHVILGGGQDAAAVTTTAGRSGKFEVRVTLCFLFLFLFALPCSLAPHTYFSSFFVSLHLSMVFSVNLCLVLWIYSFCICGVIVF